MVAYWLRRFLALVCTPWSLEFGFKEAPLFCSFFFFLAEAMSIILYVRIRKINA